MRNLVKRYVAAMIRDAKTEEGLTEENFKVGTVSGQYINIYLKWQEMYLSMYRDCSAVGIMRYGLFSVIVLLFWHKELLAALISVIFSHNKPFFNTKHSKEPARYQTYWSIWLQILLWGEWMLDIYQVDINNSKCMLKCVSVTNGCLVNLKVSQCFVYSSASLRWLNKWVHTKKESSIGRRLASYHSGLLRHIVNTLSPVI